MANHVQGANDGMTNSAAIVSALATNYSSPPANLNSPIPFPG